MDGEPPAFNGTVSGFLNDWQAVDELFSGFDWVEHFDWTLSGKGRDAGLSMDFDCPRDVLPLVAILFDMQRKDSLGREHLELKEGFSRRLKKIVSQGLMSVDAMAAVTGLEVETIQELAAGGVDRVPLTERSICLFVLVERLCPAVGEQE